MAEGAGYGRAGIAVGGKGGMSKSGAYEFGAKSAGEYLSGGLASEYTQASNVLKSDLPTSFWGAGAVGPGGAIEGKKVAKQKVGKLRDIAQSQAVGEFLGFAGSTGRGSQATASQGLITGESYTPETQAGFQYQSNFPSAGQAGRHGVKHYGSLVGELGPDIKTGLSNLATTEYGGTGPVSYAEAAMGKTGALHRSLEAEGQSVEQARALGTTSGMFQGAAESRVAPVRQSVAGRGRQPVVVAKKKATDRTTQVESARQSILAMTPAERYLQGVT